MTVHLRTTITAIGPEVADLIESGVLILFADGAPPELAEVSVLHAVSEGPSTMAPKPGSRLTLGTVEATITSIGDKAWAKMVDIGHVVVEFNGHTESDRPGVICASRVDPAILSASLAHGTELTLRA